MSVKLMSAIFETNFCDLKDNTGNVTKASTAKFVCIALADHANDDGEGAYPSIDTIAHKTNLSRTAVINALDALKYNGVLIPVGESRNRTINYTINKKCFLRNGQLSGLVNPVDSQSQPGAPSTVNPVDPNHPLTINEPSNGANAPAPETPTPSKKSREPVPPEVLLFRSVTGKFPPKVNFGDVVASVRKVARRLGRDVTRDDLLAFYKKWTGLGYNPVNLSWLEWAESGQIPQNGNWKPKQQEPRAFAAIREFLQQEVVNGIAD